jgi:hypothetical protein
MSQTTTPSQPNFSPLGRVLRENDNKLSRMVLHILLTLQCCTIELPLTSF